MLNIDDLYGEKALLQKDFDELRSRIGKVELDLNRESSLWSSLV